MAEPRINRKIALEEVNMIWDEPEIRRFERHFRDKKPMSAISKAMRRSKKEVAALALDQLTWSDFCELIGREVPAKEPIKPGAIIVTIKCSECGNPFEREMRRVGKDNYCSRACMAAGFRRRRVGGRRKK